MAIIANDFTLAYFNFSFGLPQPNPQLETIVNPIVSDVDKEFTNEMKKDEWTTTDTNSTWD
jgi:hypothetical protein